MQLGGSWVPAKAGLERDRHVVRIARATGRSAFEVVGILLAFWNWASGETADGFIARLSLAELPDVIPGTDAVFWSAVAAEEWAVERDGGVEIPKADEWLTKGAKARLLKNRRQARWRDGGESQPGESVDANIDAAPSTDASTRGEEKREDNNNPPNPPSGGNQGDDSSKPKDKRPTGRKRCPPDFALTPERIEFAARDVGIMRHRIGAVFDEMRDHEFAAAKTDWDAVWRNWCRRHLKMHPDDKDPYSHLPRKPVAIVGGRS